MGKIYKEDGIIKRKMHGYVWVLIGIRWFAEHRLVAEDILGRLLNKEEVIHHIDFNKENNNPENLALFENQKAHAHWHRQFNQFGWTQPLRTKIEIRKITNLKSSLLIS